MGHVPIAGIYMIRNKTNGKVYIGETKNLAKRFSQYRWAVGSDKDYTETKRTIVVAMRNEGIENFEFTILATGNEYKNKYTRIVSEIEYIAKFRSDNPAYGYNETAGGESGSESPRKQLPKERLKRAKQVFLYDSETESVMLYFGGCKSVGKDLDHDKDVVSHALNRGLWFLNRYYIFPASYKRRHEIFDKIAKKRKSATSHNGIADKSLKRYSAALEYVDHVARCDFQFREST